jgi:hypothetical protein
MPRGANLGKMGITGSMGGRFDLPMPGIHNYGNLPLLSKLAIMRQAIMVIALDRVGAGAQGFAGFASGRGEDRFPGND